MRTFIAILPPKAVAQQIQTALAELAIDKPTPKENLHVTLHFLGELKQPGIALTQTIMRTSCLSIPQFTCNLDSLIVFKGMYWLTCEPSPHLQKLYQNLLEELLRAKIIQNSPRPFLPHLKVGYSQAKNAQTKLKLQLKFKVEQIILFQSILSSKEPAKYLEIFHQDLLQ
jgi:2'-5' RNA ligase